MKQRLLEIVEHQERINAIVSDLASTGLDRDIICDVINGEVSIEEVLISNKVAE